MRKITVDNKEYSFQIGKRFTKVIPNEGKSFIFENKIYARQIEQTCECCGEPLHSIFGADSDRIHYAEVVTKHSVREAILAHNNSLSM